MIRHVPAMVGIARLSAGEIISTLASNVPRINVTAPKAAHTEKYPEIMRPACHPGCFAPWNEIARRYSKIIGIADGSIIAIIIAVHIAMNIPAAARLDCPDIGIHIIDITQPPGIGIPPDIC
jgi:hypothetical protein